MTASSGCPIAVQMMAVSAAAPSANQKSQPAARSASRCARDVEFCACATRRWMPASVVSSPTALTLTVIAESAVTVPATTLSPTLRVTRSDSPVIIDSSSSAVPSMITPSAGTLPPGRTITTSPWTRSAGATVSVCPPPGSPTTRSASSGINDASESSADVVCAIERISIQCPSSMMTMRSASSHQKSRS